MSKGTVVDPRHYLSGLASFGMKPGLKRIKYVLSRLGSPETGFPSVHVAGTNGKGSTVAFISSILRSAGLKVGMYTSPHIVSFAERIRVGGRNIPEEEMAGILTEIRRIAESIPLEIGYPTVFEVLTAAAFSHFAREKVDAAVIEVGMGGRWDATNVIDPLVSVITRVGLDHQEKLGDTIEKIAGEKAGIIKRNRPVISAPQTPAAAGVLARIACEKEALAYILSDSQIALTGVDRTGTTFDLKGLEGVWAGLKTGLLGRHQAVNASTAVATAGVLRAWYGERFNLGESAIREGILTAEWPGRLEIVKNDPLVVLDGAHNPDGVGVLSQALQEVFAGERKILVLGILAEKAVDEIVERLLPLAWGVICTAPLESRTPPVPPGELAGKVKETAGELGVNLSFIEYAEAPKALERACQLARDEGAMVCVTGSLYLVGEIRGIIKGGSTV